MSNRKNNVIIKGTKEGLVFHLDDTCSLDDLFEELRDKVENSHQRILTGPVVRITVKLGRRYLTAEQEQELTEILRTRGNLIVQAIESEVITKEDALHDKLSSQIRIYPKTVRSGQIISQQGDLLLLGDVNPGALISCTGSIFVLGSLMGTAHAGCEGNTESIIAAYQLLPNQLRIAGVISRPPEEWEDKTMRMEFAYLHNGRMAIEKMTHIHKIRPELGEILMR
ncbi:septum site-determining protein MinC [Aneurinibacillus sp. Ricciae_BoGa-3]|uniref:septum site-determining protein MinC n=1 Tax=Aneurinibacillus sp. Ricciae_BoGa-3 TaxID=3022697 RepID=UPI00233FF186|nr:septum site-determining protein MinC [Aneurinibacillus sp. Ricciae_BoGa-3]WCK53640.1 septum site-determining protein MinC [Aneurinibacillus sp. Ricciae_BoGa-3]